jgi:3-oxoacyl-[acyl-carrier protein] reductase
LRNKPNFYSKLILQPMSLLTGKVALVSGGSRGIGASIVERLAAEGAAIAFTYRSSAGQAEALVEKIVAAGGKAQAYASDAADFEGTQNLVNQVIKDFGKLDILVNNAGITRDNLLLRMTEQQWDEVQLNNLKSVFNFCKAASRQMLKQKSGSIINISSVVGIHGNAGQANYAAAKAGIISFTKSMAQEMGSRQIRCNVIAPGFVETDMTHGLTEEVKQQVLATTPLGRFAQPEEIANAVLFLASDLSSYITAEVISVSGGMR